MVKVLLDTSVIIEESRMGGEIYHEVIKQLKNEEIKVYISAVVWMELWAGDSMSDISKCVLMERRLQPFRTIDVDEIVSKKAGEVKRNFGVAGIDALIAATAIVHGATLATLNTKHFVGIKGLKLYNTSK